MNSWTCSNCGVVVAPYAHHVCYYNAPAITTGTSWNVPIGSNTVILGTSAYPWQHFAPTKPTPYWQKHKREPKWHLYANGGALCEGFQEHPQFSYGHINLSNEEFLVEPSPPEPDKCEDCLAEYAALKLQDKVE